MSKILTPLPLYVIVLTMDRSRQIAAAIVGILIIVVLVLLARWTGDRIRERFLTPKLAPVVAPKTTPIIIPPVEPQTNVTIRTATYSAIPATGPADFGYFLIGLFFLSGLSLSALSRRIV